MFEKVGKKGGGGCITYLKPSVCVCVCVNYETGEAIFSCYFFNGVVKNVEIGVYKSVGKNVGKSV